MREPRLLSKESESALTQSKSAGEAFTRVFNSCAKPRITPMPFLQELPPPPCHRRTLRVGQGMGGARDGECGRLGQLPEGNPRAAVVPTENISPAGVGRGHVSSLGPEARGRSDQLFLCPSNSSQTSLLFPFPSPSFFILFHNGMFKKKKKSKIK